MSVELAVEVAGLTSALTLVLRELASFIHKRSLVKRIKARRDPDDPEGENSPAPYTARWLYSEIKHERGARHALGYVINGTEGRPGLVERVARLEEQRNVSGEQSSIVLTPEERAQVEGRRRRSRP
jgi:hypothetical protein